MTGQRLIGAALFALLAACRESGPERPDHPPKPERPALGNAAHEAPSPASASGAASIAAPAATGTSAAAGAWEGKFDAKKGNVEMPENVKDKTREKDDGKSGVGAGVVRLVVAPDGEVTGSWTGALGKDDLRGRIEVEGGRTMLRATAQPVDAAARDAMTGILVGELKGDAIVAEIHVSAGDAVTVREAALELKRK